MRRRFFLAGLLAAGAAGAASGQTIAAAPSRPPPLIRPENALEAAFLLALERDNLRPNFRRQLLDSHVALALTSNAPDAPPREISIREGASACLIFTSAARLDSVLGPAAPRVILSGRAALERVRGRNAILNARLNPMLTLEAEDIALYLDAPGSPASAGPAQ